MVRASLSYFGRVVWTAMTKRGVMSYADLAAFMQERGYDFTRDALRNWLQGRTQVSKDFPPAFAEVFVLDEKERAELADAFTYHQDDHIT